MVRRILSLAALLLVASLPLQGSAGPRIIAGTATTSVCYNGPGCGPPPPGTFFLGEIDFLGNVTIKGRNYQGAFNTRPAIAQVTGTRTAKIPPVALEGTSPLGRTLSGTCSGLIVGVHTLTPRILLDCTGQVSGGTTGKVSLQIDMIAITDPDPFPGPTAISETWIGVYRG